MTERGKIGKITETLARFIPKPKETAIQRAARILEGGITDKDRSTYVSNLMSAATFSVRGIDGIGMSPSLMDPEITSILHASNEEIDARLTRNARETLRSEAEKRNKQ